MGGRAVSVFLAALVLALLAGCLSQKDAVQRATEGPTADEICRARFVRGYGRGPSFDETAAWREDFEKRVSAYIRSQPGMVVSPRVSQFRRERRVAVGMTREEVTLLVGAPDAITSDEKLMEVAAKQFWPEVRKHTKEMWIYPDGWQLYFDDDRLVDLTVIGRLPLE